MKVFVIVAVMIVSALAAPGVIDNTVESDSSMSKMMQYFRGCADNEDFTTCLAVKGITALSRAARASNIKITEGVTLARDPSFNARAGKAVSENEIVSSLPTEPEERSGRLYDLALESISNFFQSHSLQVKFPTEEVARAFAEEGRKKKLKKLIPALLVGLVGKKIFALVPIFLVGLALLSVKALITAKLAFFLAIFLTLSKAMSGGSGSGLGILGKVAGLSGGAGGLLGGLGGSTGSSGGYANSGSSGYSNGGGSQGWSSGSGSSGYPYARSYDEAQDLAYNGHAQTE